jgi:glycosyltransferase involved in cell wall biosynthesis
MGHDVQMVTSDRSTNGTGLHGWRHTDETGIRVHWLPVPYSNHMDHAQRMRAFVRFAWSASRKAAALRGDVVFATSTPLTIAVPAAYAAWKNQIPMVFEVRDLWPTVPIALGALRSPVTVGAGRLLEQVAYRNAAHIVALSPGMKAGVVGTGYPEDRVTVIPNACDLEVFDVGPTPGLALRHAHEWLHDRPLVVYTGTLGRVNGVAYLAYLAAEVGRVDPSVRFVVIGGGKEEAAIRHTAERLGVLGRTFFMFPEIPKAEIAHWLSAADIATSLVIDVPELWSNSANKVFDALAAGKPVAINHEGWQADLFRETGAGLVLEPHDVNAAAASLATALQDRQWLAQAAGAARALARGRFNRDRLAAQLEGVLRKAKRNADHTIAVNCTTQ